jgi:hypothetical protein
MCLVEVRVEIEATEPGCDPQASVFIDLRPDLDLGSEMALPLRRAGRARWLGAFTVSEAGPSYFLYRVGLAAHRDARWTITLAERAQGRSRTLFSDGDVFSIPKHWLVGTCGLRPAEQPRRSVPLQLIPGLLHPAGQGTRRTR